MIKCKSFLFLLALFSVDGMIRQQYANKGGLSREKRTLIWPPGASKLLAICGFGVPVASKPETVIVGTVFKANYVFPTNISAITEPFVTYERKRREVSRWDLYSLLVQALEFRGFNGKSCLLRAICEVAQVPLVQNLGLFHELIHIFFTPTSTRENIKHHADNEYYAAQDFGKKKETCENIFKDCTTNFLDLFTVLESVPSL